MVINDLNAVANTTIIRKIQKGDIVHLCMATNVHQDKIEIFIFTSMPQSKIFQDLIIYLVASQTIKILVYKEC